MQLSKLHLQRVQLIRRTRSVSLKGGIYRNLVCISTPLSLPCVAALIVLQGNVTMAAGELGIPQPHAFSGEEYMWLKKKLYIELFIVTSKARP